MTCQQAQPLLSERLDGCLELAQEQQLQAHLDGCSECRREWSDLERSWQWLGELPELEPGPLFRAQVWEKIRQQASPAIARGRGLWSGWFGWLLAATSVCFLWLGWMAQLPAPLVESPSQLMATPRTLQVAQAELEEWHLDVELLPPMEALGESEVALDDSVPLGDLSHHYLAHSDEAFDEMLEEM